MANINLAYSASTALSVSGLSTLASGSAATSSACDATATRPLDVLVELSVTTGTPSGNKQALLFLITSADGSNYSDSSNAANMILLGAMSTPASSTAYRSREFSIAAAVGGVVPNHYKLVVKNDGGGTYSAGAVAYREISATVA